MIGSDTTNLTISTEEMNDIMKIIKSLEAKELKGGFVSMLLGTLGANLLRNLLTGKSKIKAGEGTISVGQNF